MVGHIDRQHGKIGQTDDENEEGFQLRNFVDRLGGGPAYVLWKLAVTVDLSYHLLHSVYASMNSPHRGTHDTSFPYGPRLVRTILK